MCLICDRIKMIQNGTNPYFVKELETKYVVIGDNQHFRGYTLFLYKHHGDNASLMEYVLSCVAEDKAVLIALVQENVSGSFDSVFTKFGAEITRFDAAEVAAEVDEAARVQEEIAKQAKKELREAKKNDRKQAIAERRSKIASQFAEISSKFKK